MWVRAWCNTMQLRAVALCTCVQVTLAISGPTSDHLPEPEYKYDLLPTRPTLQEAKGQAAITGMNAQWSSLEATAFATQASIAADTVAANRARLLATENKMKLTAAAASASISASRVDALRRRAQQVAAETREMIDSIPANTDKAIARAVDDAVNAAVERMNAQVRGEVVANQQSRMLINTASDRFAADQAQRAALPMQTAKLRRFQRMYSDISESQSLGVIVNQLKTNADGMARQAQDLQRQGEGVIAKELHSQARELIGVAGKVKDKATSLYDSANSIREHLNDGDPAAKAAAAYASFQASLNATKLDPLPPPPLPLTLPPTSAP